MRKLKNFKLSDHTSLRVGGLALNVCEIQSPSDIQEFVHEYGNQEFFVLGGGSNIVAPDHEIKTPIAYMQLVNSSTKTDGDFVEITAGAGMNWELKLFQEFLEQWALHQFKTLELMEVKLKLRLNLCK